MAVMGKKYLISGKELKILLYMANKCAALENSGVDNWEWYSSSIYDYLDLRSEENDYKFSSLEEVADYELRHNYKEV
jgi:hypothetical protein